MIVVLFNVNTRSIPGIPTLVVKVRVILFRGRSGTVYPNRVPTITGISIFGNGLVNHRNVTIVEGARNGPMITDDGFRMPSLVLVGRLGTITFH